MKLSINKQENYTILKLEEENLNSILSPNLKSEFVFYYNEGVKNLILDLSDVKFVDSSGLSSILVADRLWKKLGSFIITGVKHDSVKRLIEISRLESVLKIIPTVEDAIHHVQVSNIEESVKAKINEEES